MRRRQFLTACSALAAAGCVGGGGSAPTATPDGAEPSPSGTGEPVAARDEPSAPPATVDGVDLPVEPSEMRHPLPRDYIPAIVDPAFAEDWDGLEADGAGVTLPDSAPVIGVERGGTARAYPLRILDRHEVVNDDLAGSIAVTYCVLCGSGVVFRRRVADRSTTFGVSGKLWRSDLVMYDELTDSLWSQLLAAAIDGPRTGDRLGIVPSTLTTWSEWRSIHSGTRVLLPPPRSGTVGTYDRSFDYSSPKYDYAGESQLVGRDSYDGGLHPKTLVVGVETGATARAYPFPVVEVEEVVTDTVGDRPVVVTVTPDGVPVAYDRRTDAGVLEFRPAGDRFLAGGGSRWDRRTGTALDGPLVGSRLGRANDRPPMFWTGWSAFEPGTEVYGLAPSRSGERPRRRLDGTVPSGGSAGPRPTG